MKPYITSKQELTDTVKEAVGDLLEQELPALLRKAKRKEWMTTNELMELTGWSRRTIQYLRDQKRIPYSQENHRILYPTEGIEAYLRANQIEPKQ